MSAKRLFLIRFRAQWGGCSYAEICERDIEEVRDLMIKAEWSCKYVNGSIGRIKRLFKWATEMEIGA